MFLLRSQTEYLGHVIDTEELHPTAEKVRAIQEARKPQNVSELRSFFDIINYYNRCHVKMGTPQNGDPGSPFSYEIRDPGPQFLNIFGTLGSPILYNIRDPSMKSGTPMNFFCLAKFFHHHAINSNGHFNFS